MNRQQVVLWAFETSDEDEDVAEKDAGPEACSTAPPRRALVEDEVWFAHQEQRARLQDLRERTQASAIVKAHVPLGKPHQLEQVPGLVIFKGFLMQSEQRYLEGQVMQWFHQAEDSACTHDAPFHNQAIRFGTRNMPPWALEVAARIRFLSCAYPQITGVKTPIFPQRKIVEREPMFDSLIGNLYFPGEGISRHVDLVDRFADGIISLSLMSHTVMLFEECEDDTHTQGGPDGGSLEVLLEPGDLLAFSGDARYKWTHSIAARRTDSWHGTKLVRGDRVSVTMRRLINKEQLPGAR